MTDSLSHACSVLIFEIHHVSYVKLKTNKQIKPYKQKVPQTLIYRLVGDMTMSRLLCSSLIHILSLSYVLRTFLLLWEYI